ncbi:hypothetical protein HMPREF5505_1862 [Lactobacillus delbrueckii subsp. lactis DSM 20072]|nr:hypothetical protein HMPREF5505_1862 [Lactobacillus delbrueckii subsp. lactis DSM 20072]
MILNALNLLQGIFYWLMSILFGIIAEKIDRRKSDNSRRIK